MEIAFTLRPRRLARGLFLVTLGLAAISLLARSWLHLGLPGYRPMLAVHFVFDLDRERTVPALVEVALLLCSAAVLAVFARGAPRRDAPYWAVLAAGFAVMAVDEAWSFHEHMDLPALALFGGALPAGFGHGWVLVGLAVVVVVAIGFAGFLRRLPRPLATRLLVAGAIYVGGALGVEMVCAAYMQPAGSSRYVEQIFVAVEESMEMAGVVLLLHALLDHLAGGAEVLEVTLSARAGGAAPGVTASATRDLV